MPHPETFTRSLSLAPGSFDRAAGTVRATISTGAPVRRRGFIERLALTPDAVAIGSHVPVLDAHRQGSIADVLGRVADTQFRPGAIEATLRITSPAALDAIERGDITGVSVGYQVGAWSDSRSDGELTRTATNWRLMEVSLVPLPADSGAVLRSEKVMSETTEAEAATGAPANRAETNAAIRSLATTAGLDTAFANAQIDAGATIEVARSAALDAILRRGVGTIRTQRAEVGTSNDDPAVMAGRMTEALTARCMPSQQPSEAARPFMALGLVDMARTLLQARGERVALASREEVITRAMHTTSDFPNLLTGTGNRVLMGAYQAAPNPLKALARQAALPDFRAKSLLKLSDLPKLQPVNEQGEVKAATRSETRDGYSLATFGQIFSLSRKGIINDDLGAFTDWNVAMGRAAAETEADQLVQLLLAASGAGPTMGDSKTLFHTAHGNVAATGAAPSVSTLSDGRAALRNQKGVDGATPVNATAKFLLVGSALETVAEQMLASIYAAAPAGANPFSGQLTLLVEPRLSGNAWWLFADPAVMPVLEYAYLSSAPGPQLAAREGWDTLGMEFRCILDFGCGTIDWRGAYRNAGQ